MRFRVWDDPFKAKAAKASSFRVQRLQFRVWGCRALKVLMFTTLGSKDLGFRVLGLEFRVWVVVKILVPFWIPIIIRHLIFRALNPKP